MGEQTKKRRSLCRVMQLSHQSPQLLLPLWINSSAGQHPSSHPLPPPTHPQLSNSILSSSNQDLPGIIFYDVPESSGSSPHKPMPFKVLFSERSDVDCLTADAWPNGSAYCLPRKMNLYTYSAYKRRTSLHNPDCILMLMMLKSYCPITKSFARIARSTERVVGSISIYKNPRLLSALQIEQITFLMASS